MIDFFKCAYKRATARDDDFRDTTQCALFGLIVYELIYLSGDRYTYKWSIRRKKEEVYTYYTSLYTHLTNI